MKTTRYQYPQYLRIFTMGMNVLGFLIPIYLFGRTFYRLYSVDHQVTWEFILVIPLLALLAFGAFVIIILTANFFPEIIISDHGLEVQFLWRFIPVSWSEIVEIYAKKNIFGRQSYWVVKTHTLTLFHRLYGIFYGRTNLPSFIINPALENCDEVIRRINSLKQS